MYICKPERSVTQTRVLLFLCALVSLALFFISSVIEAYKAFVEFCGIAAVLVSILLVVRYTLTEFEYAVCDGSFSVTKIVGNKRTVVCQVALETAIDLYEKRDYDHLPSGEKAIIKYSLNQNPKAESYVYLCSFNGKRAMIEFEPNKQFVAILKNEIKAAKHNSEDFNA
ncbi:MAG: hypothetical protein IKZ05_01360 [Clostridia bacterium]|nr:hypothetical protein [Clostridia bacterium]